VRMNLTGEWIVEKVATAATKGGEVTVRMTMLREDIDPETLPRYHRVHCDALVAEVRAAREADDVDPAWPWTARKPQPGWSHLVDIDGTERGMRPAKLVACKTQESTEIDCRVVVEVVADRAETVGMLAARTGYPQRMASEREQGELPGVAA